MAATSTFPLLLLLLLLRCCPEANTDSQISCPLRCQCFTPAQVLCAYGGLPYLPRNTSSRILEFMIMSSELHYLFSHTLPHSPHLTKLVFLNNQLHSIHSQAFQHLVELQELEISGNPALVQLLPGTLSKQGNLTTLMLNHNNLEALLPDAFESLTKLEFLQLKGNNITEVPWFLFRHLQELRVLDLSLNKLTMLREETFAGLTGLEVLRISSNLVENLPPDTFHNCSELTEIHLESNRISEVANDTFALAKLKVLNLQRNLLTTFSDRVFGRQAQNLTELNLSGNRLIEVSPLGRLTSLSTLLLSSNHLHELPRDFFRDMHALDYLDLSENQLTLLPEMLFIDLIGIRVMHLHKNNLSRLEPRQFESQSLLQQLYLSDNQLKSLPEGVFDPLAIHHTMRLHGNPWRCDCHLIYLHDWTLKNSQSVEMLDRVLCERPLFLHKRPVASVTSEQLVCWQSGEQAPDLSPCRQEIHNDTLTVRCRVGKGSPVSVRVQFLEKDGQVHEHVVQKLSNCSHQVENETSTQ